MRFIGYLRALNMKSSNQIITFQDVSLTIKREDLLHPIISGNKYRKLKYNLQEAKAQQKDTLLTFGGAFSNHIAAVAGAGKEYGFKTIGIIRGEELVDKVVENPTLSYSKQCGMELIFVPRALYREKDTIDFFDTIEQLKPFRGKLQKEVYMIPEGGTNELAIKGCEEILTEEDATFDYVCVCVGTGGTISGLINSAKAKQKILGFSALKGNFLKDEIEKLTPNKNNWQLITDYHFGGYGKINDELISFINQFKQVTSIPLDPIYTGKMLYGIIDLTQKGYFEPNSKILAIHTGGLQGVEGMNRTLQKQGKTLISS